MRKLIALLLAATVLALAGCSSAREFDQDWMIGKTAEEIQQRYGEFDAGKPYDEDYRNCECRYYIERDTKAEPGEIAKDLVLVIKFHNNGKAYTVYEKTELRRVTLPGQYAEPVF